MLPHGAQAARLVRIQNPERTCQIGKPANRQPEKRPTFPGIALPHGAQAARLVDSAGPGFGFSGLRFWGLGFGSWVLGFGFWGLGFEFRGLEVEIWGLGFGVEC